MTEFSYNNWRSSSDKHIIETIGTYVKHHRISQNKSQKEVAESAGISRSTLSLLENGEPISISTLIQVLRVLDQLHVFQVFKIEQTISPIALAKLQREKRQRSRKKTNK